MFLSHELYIVIVLYYPSQKQLEHLNKISNIYYTIAVDNTPNATSNIKGDKLHYIQLGYNQGIAIAQNVGIRKVEDLGGKYILFIDQDSMIDVCFPAEILNEYKKIKLHLQNLAAIGPMIKDIDSNTFYKDYGSKKNNFQNYIMAPTLISSGSIFSVDIFKDVGLMEEKLFIDYVDHEWCWRAMSKGYVCCMSRKLFIEHKVGKRKISFFGYSFLISSSFRYFYQYRNFLWLIRRNYVPIKWKIRKLISSILGMIIYTFFSNNHLLTLKYILKGIKAGLK